MEKLELTLADDVKFVVEVKKCSKTNREYVLTHMVNPEAPLDECKTYSLTCTYPGGGTETVTAKCKTANTTGDCTVRPPTLTCDDGSC
ncbi:hypothetical protein MKY59_20780 [Paenibacillus sp. FSL W8-0426]|uniref:hypothetical protein n=1 Tax=Paenibacillus sp. FSL W8-0426 TaxID=2921714 RepID=UPI0030D9F458